jgi:hypothetical protein
METVKSKITVHFKDGQTFEYNHRNNAPINAMTGLQFALKGHMKLDSPESFNEAMSHISQIVMDMEVN